MVWKEEPMYAGWIKTWLSFPGGSVGKEYVCQCRRNGSIPGLGRSPGGGNGNTLQYSCRNISIDRGDWRAIVHGVAKE